eukprot:172652-Amphidinium_carterae.1
MYQNTCTNELKYSYIEPLAGPLRHPGVCIRPFVKHWDRFKFSKNWMVLDQWDVHKGMTQYSQVYYFDAGASTWEKGLGGASQAWFDTTYDSLCAPFDGYWMWEVTPTDAAKVFRVLPRHVKPKYRWYNIPASPNRSDSDSPLFHVTQVAKPQDYVVFKLDIDNNPVEEAIVRALLEDTVLLGLID